MLFVCVSLGCWLGQVELTGINLYDVREKCQHPPLCYDFSRLEKLAADPSFMAALGVTGHTCEAQRTTEEYEGKGEELEIRT